MFSPVILEFKIVRTYGNPDSAEKTFQSHWL